MVLNLGVIEKAGAVNVNRIPACTVAKSFRKGLSHM